MSVAQYPWKAVSPCPSGRSRFMTTGLIHTDEDELVNGKEAASLTCIEAHALDVVQSPLDPLPCASAVRLVEHIAWRLDIVRPGEPVRQDLIDGPMPQFGRGQALDQRKKHHRDERGEKEHRVWRGSGMSKRVDASETSVQT